MKILTIIVAAFLFIGGCLEPTTGKSTTTDSTGNMINSGSAGIDSMEVKGSIEYIIFGRFCGRCRSGKCAPMYKLDLQKKQLSLDNSNHYSEGVPLVFNEKLSQEQYSKASPLATKIPDSLYKTKEKRFGCPNCADQCGIYLEIKKGGKKYSFELDNDTEALNGYIKKITIDLQKVIDDLRPVLK